MLDKLNSFVWKGKKILTSKSTFEQETTRLMDMYNVELSSKYKHCKDMLYNESKNDPGRYVVLDEISKQINNCGAELAVRWFCQLVDEEGRPKYTKFTLMTEIRNLLSSYKNVELDKVFRVQDLYSGIPSDFKAVTIDSVLKAAKDSLGKFNRRHITQSFILQQGIWFTSEELKEFDPSAKTAADKIQVVKERLNLRQDLKVNVNSYGLTYAQFRAMLQLKVNKKYSELTSFQLETLKNKVLFTLEEQVLFHISSWTRRMGEIEMVAEYKGFKL